MQITKIQNINFTNANNAISKINKINFRENTLDTYTKSQSVTTRKSDDCGCDGGDIEASWGITC